MTRKLGNQKMGRIRVAVGKIDRSKAGRVIILKNTHGAI
jgi:hypothetical protein